MSYLTERFSEAWDKAFSTLERNRAKKEAGRITTADAIPQPMNFAGDNFVIVRDPQTDNATNNTPFSEDGIFIDQGSRR